MYCTALKQRLKVKDAKILQMSSVKVNNKQWNNWMICKLNAWTWNFKDSTKDWESIINEGITNHD